MLVEQAILLVLALGREHGVVALVELGSARHWIVGIVFYRIPVSRRRVSFISAALETAGLGGCLVLCGGAIWLLIARLFTVLRVAVARLGCSGERSIRTVFGNVEGIRSLT